MNKLWLGWQLLKTTDLTNEAWSWVICIYITLALSSYIAHGMNLPVAHSMINYLKGSSANKKVSLLAFLAATRTSALWSSFQSSMSLWKAALFAMANDIALPLYFFATRATLFLQYLVPGKNKHKYAGNDWGVYRSGSRILLRSTTYEDSLSLPGKMHAMVLIYV